MKTLSTFEGQTMGDEGTPPATEGRVTLTLVLAEVRRSEDRTTGMVEALANRLELLFEKHGQTHEKHDVEHEAEEFRRNQRIKWVVTTVMSGALGLSGWAALLWSR